MRFDEVLRTFSGFFEREGVRYALAGGIAVRAWGHSRPTQDTDFVVGGVDQQRVIGFAESLGYLTTFRSEGYSNHRHPTESFGNVDFIYVYGDTAEQVFRGAVKREVFEVQVPVTKPEHLVAMKVTAMANSPHRVLIDAPDIAYLLTLPDIDRANAREQFARHGLLRIFDELENDHRK